MNYNIIILLYNLFLNFLQDRRLITEVIFCAIRFEQFLKDNFKQCKITRNKEKLFRIKCRTLIKCCISSAI
jgi:hypothetical protein